MEPPNCGKQKMVGIKITFWIGAFQMRGNILGTELCPKVSLSIVILSGARLAALLLESFSWLAPPSLLPLNTPASKWTRQTPHNLERTLALHCIGPTTTPTAPKGEGETLWIVWRRWVGLVVSRWTLAQYDTLDPHDHDTQFAKSIIPATGNRPWLAITTDWPTGRD